MTQVPRPSIAPEAVETAEAAEEERRVSGLDPVLELRALFVGEPAGLDSLSDAVLQPFFERLLERARLDAKLGRSVFDDRLALVVDPSTRDPAIAADAPRTTASRSARAAPATSVTFLFLSMWTMTPGRPKTELSGS